MPPPLALADLPASFPVFPLTGALLLPRGRLPLNVFEPRYLALVEDALGQRRLFGMIQPDANAAPTAAGPALYRVGCLGRIVSFSETEDDRYLITLAGLIRFHLDEEIGLTRGYRRVRADFTRFAADLGPAPALPGFDRPSLLALLRPYFAQRSIEANWDAIGRLPDDGLITTLAMVCPFDAAEKQALLEAPTVAERAAALATLLQIDVHAPETDTAPARSRAS